METTPNENISLSTDLNDPLDEDLSKMDTSYPTAPNGYVGNFQVKSADVKPNKDNTGQMLAIKLANLQEITSNPINGESKQVAPGGIVITHFIGITPLPARPNPDKPGQMKQPYTPVDICMSVAKVMQWGKVTGITGKQFLADPNPFCAQITGKSGPLKIELTKERTDEKTGITYAPANRVKQFVNQ